MRNVREQPCPFVHLPAGLPAFHSTIQTSECLDKGRLCPSSAGLLPAPLRLSIIPPPFILLHLSLFTFQALTPEKPNRSPLKINLVMLAGSVCFSTYRNIFLCTFFLSDVITHFHCIFLRFNTHNSSVLNLWI